MKLIDKLKKSIVVLTCLQWSVTLFGATFIGMEIYEFQHLVHAGHGPTHSAFLSAFFTLVGTHGIHVTSGLVWMLVLMYQIKKNGLTLPNTRRLDLFGNIRICSSCII